MELKIGIVENNIDPDKLGKCQVRIFGLHSEDRTIYPTSDLPWAIYITNSTNISNEGNFFIPNNGDFVAVSFLDIEMQNPIILGVIPKFLKELPSFTSGFSDPNGNYPSSTYIDESGISRLARNENIDQTIIQTKKDNRKTGVSCGSVSFDEPETPYNAEYPKNKVISTKNHVIELDDTDGIERLHIYHKSGSSVEYHPNGDVVEIAKAKKFLIIDSDENIFIGGNKNIHIDGDENLKIIGNQTVDIGGDQKFTSTKLDFDSGGDITITSSGKIVLNASSNVEVNASGQVIVKGSTVELN